MSTFVRLETELIAFETIYLDWIRNIGIFIIISAAFLSFIGTQHIAYWLTIISIFLLFVAQIDYIVQRENLTQQNVSIPIRLDLLWFGSSGFLLILLWMLYKMSFPESEWSKHFAL